MKRLFFLLLLVILAGCGGGGGGGGGTGSKVTVQGRILWIETGAGPNPQATVTVGTDSTLTDVIDGFFQFDVAEGSTKLKATFGSVVRTFDFAPIFATRDLGDLYIGPQSVTVRGTAKDASNGSPIANAIVTVGGRQATTAANGAFSVVNVAYSSANPSVFLGLDCVVSATNYFSRHFSPDALESGGVVQLGVIELTPLGSQNPPPPPFDVQGTVLPSGQGGGATVQLLQGSNVIRTVTADTNGKFTFWVPTGTYTLKAKLGSRTGTTSFTLSSTNVIRTVNVTY